MSFAPQLEAVTATNDAGSRVVLSHPADLSDWGHRRLETPWARASLRKTLGEVREGAVTEEFLDVGCRGATLDVPLRVDVVEGGTTVGPDTTVEYAVRETCDLDGGWLVQGVAGP